MSVGDAYLACSVGQRLISAEHDEVVADVMMSVCGACMVSNG